MKSHLLRNIFLFAATLPLIFALATINVTAEDGDKPAVKKETTKKVVAKKVVPKKKKKRAKARGRLPNYYNKVVDKEQREKIYAIQGKHNLEIQKLVKQIRELTKQRSQLIQDRKALTEKRNTEIKALLTEEQVKEVEALVAESKAKQVKRKAKKKAEK